MGYQTGILAALRDWGLTVVEVPGWKTRGSSDFSPRGFVAHHDVIPPTTSCPSIIVDGRSDLPGPLSQFWLERNGRVHLVAAGRANHAGEGGWHGLTGNSSVWGCEANNLGTADHPWPQVQLDAYIRLAAACADFSGFPPANVCGHKEWAPTRKIDPHSIDMGTFRARVQSAQKDEGFTVADIDKLINVIQAQGKLTRKAVRRQGLLVRLQNGKLAKADQKDLDAILAELKSLGADED